MKSPNALFDHGPVSFTPLSNSAVDSVTVSQAEWSALVRQLEELKMWRDRKIVEDDVFRRQVQDSFLKLNEEVVGLSGQVETS